MTYDVRELILFIASSQCLTDGQRRSLSVRAANYLASLGVK